MLSIQTLDRMPARVSLPFLTAMLEKQGPDVKLLARLARQCVELNQYEQAATYIARLSQSGAVDDKTLIAMAGLRLRAGDPGGALKILRAVQDETSAGGDFLATLSAVHLALGDVDSAEQTLAQLREKHRDHPQSDTLLLDLYYAQRNFPALVDACRRVMACEPCAQAYAQYIQASHHLGQDHWRRLAEPAGIVQQTWLVAGDESGTASLTGQLADYLARQDGWVQNPAEYATNGGRDLKDVVNPISLETPVIRDLVRQLESAAARYIEMMRGLVPDWFEQDVDRVRLDSWAVCLARDGFQQPHFHPSGWVSGVLYLEVENSASKGDLELGFRTSEGGFDVLHRITPMPGKLVFFPSYLEHRTLPYQGTHERVSIAFDLLLDQ